ncbi:hypothetical protein [Salinicoccus sp. CNSTN-B1]
MIRLLFGKEDEPADEMPEVLTESKMFQIPAMINMEGVTPYDFN